MKVKELIEWLNSNARPDEEIVIRDGRLQSDVVMPTILASDDKPYVMLVVLDTRMAPSASED